VPEKKHIAVYPHLSDDNTRICDACYFSIRRDYPAQAVTPAAAIAAHTQNMVSSVKRRLTIGMETAERKKDSSQQDMLAARTPAGHTRGYDALSPGSKRARAFSTVDASAVTVTDECVIVREHMLMLLISLVSCGRFTAKLASGDLAVPAYVLSQRDITTPVQLFPEISDSPHRQCPGELKLTSKKGFLVRSSISVGHELD
jgi:hypothetical protein